MSPPIPTYIELAPVSGATGQDFICRSNPAPDPSKYLTLQAGGKINVQWEFTAAHPGDCFLYLTYDTGVPESQMQWFKIAELPDCKSQNLQNVPVTIPNYIASCDHCIMRWDWYGLHLWPSKVEFYAQCVDVKIVADPNFANPALGAPRFGIPGHMPSTNFGQTYRDPFSGTTANFLTGPPLAKYDAGSLSSINAGTGPVGSTAANAKNGGGKVNVVAAVVLPILAVLVIAGIVGAIYLKKKRPDTWHNITEKLDGAKNKVVDVKDNIKAGWGVVRDKF